MKKKIGIIVLIIIIILLIGKLYQSYALTSIITSSDDDSIIVNVYDNSTITVPANSGKTVYYKITNPNDGQLRYGIGYTNGNIDVKIYSDSRDDETDLINYGESKFVKLILINATSSSSSVTLSTIFGYVNGGDLIVPSGVSLVSEKFISAQKYIEDDLYNLSTKTEVDNNNITYQYDTTHNLMKDVGGNIRYYGASPNNYIYFNCSDYSNQSDSTCEKWRIIGVFNGKLKIIRNSIIGNYSWDNKLSGVGTSISVYGSNDWSDSRLMIVLNSTEYSSGFSTDIYAYDKGSYYYGLSSTCYAGSKSGTKVCDFTSIGLKNDTTRNLISEETYYLRGYSNISTYSDEMYNYERTTGSVYSGRSTSWVGKVALAYPSDYGYAVDFNYCTTQTLSSYGDSTCTSNNWMKDILGTSSYAWLLTPYSRNPHIASYVNSSGNLDYVSTVYMTFGVVPVLHLDPSLEIKAGDGSSNTPYQLEVN